MNIGLRAIHRPAKRATVVIYYRVFGYTERRGDVGVRDGGDWLFLVRCLRYFDVGVELPEGSAGNG